MEGEGEQADGGTTHVFMDRGSPANPGLYPGLWESAASECCCRAHAGFTSPSVSGSSSVLKSTRYHGQT
ncbi:hypothetical protein NQZ68_000873 [Dissostichus eleginoides]|nr:hypothetical protein NQZ68_000873 [Dissostichus eleginoides]